MFKKFTNFIKYMSVVNSRTLFALGVLVSTLFVLPMIVMALPYTLGETLEPSCAPGVDNCTVTAPSPSTGTTTLVTLGTVTTGVWNGTVVDTDYGGTGTSTLGTVGTVAYSDGTDYAFTATGTSGYYLQANGDLAPSWTEVSAGAWTTSGDDIYYTTGQIGVGTTTPASAVHAYYTSDFEGIFSQNPNATGNSNFYVGEEDGNGGDGIYGYLRWVGDGDYLSLGTDTSGNSGSVNDNTLVIKDGKVGIGTTTPRSVLDLANYYFPDADGTNGYVLKTNGADQLTWQEGSSIIDGTATGQTTVWDGSAWTPTSSLMVVDGKVGIGTVAPDTKLHILGTGEAAWVRAEATGVGFDAKFIMEVESEVGSYASLDFNKDSTLKAQLYLDDNADNDLYIDVDNNNLIIDTGTGKVGIGTDSPAYELDVVGTIRSIDTIIAKRVSDNARVVIKGDTGYDAVAEYMSGDTYPRWAIGRDGFGAGMPGITFGPEAGDTVFAQVGSGVGLPESRNLAFYTSNATALTERMRIDKDGNVGIGTTTPELTLQVNGTDGYVPSSDTSITAGGGITITKAIQRIVGAGGAVDITADPQIVDGSDGQIVIIQGTSDTNLVKLDDGTGLALSGGVSFTLGNNDIISLMYDSGESEWIELYRSNNS